MRSALGSRRAHRAAVWWEGLAAALWAGARARGAAGRAEVRSRARAEAVAAARGRRWVRAAAAARPVRREVAARSARGARSSEAVAMREARRAGAAWAVAPIRRAGEGRREPAERLVEGAAPRLVGLLRPAGLSAMRDRLQPADSSGGATAGTCDVSEPPANVAAWINESWQKEGKNNIQGRTAWLADAAMKGKGQINVCVRWGATSAMTVAVRDKLESQMQGWFNQWFSRLYGYDCFPYESVAVKITGYAVRPGKESLLPAGTSPVYTQQESGSTPAGEPKCPDECGFFFNWNHSFPKCAGGEESHFDYSLWLDDALPGSGAAAVGGDWGLRMPLSGFTSALGSSASMVILHEMGHGFGLSDYYSWTGSTPAGGSIMIVGSTSSQVPTTADQWMARRYWKETKALRYP